MRLPQALTARRGFCASSPLFEQAVWVLRLFWAPRAPRTRAVLVNVLPLRCGRVLGLGNGDRLRSSSGAVRRTRV